MLLLAAAAVVRIERPGIEIEYSRQRLHRQHHSHNTAQRHNIHHKPQPPFAAAAIIEGIVGVCPCEVVNEEEEEIEFPSDVAKSDDAHQQHPVICLRVCVCMCVCVCVCVCVCACV